MKRDYAIESGDTLLPRDKFEISPQQLELKDVLGSGAYGIVRLATLQDEFGAVTDVAVKMMKGIITRIHVYTIKAKTNRQNTQLNEKRVAK